MGTNYYFCKKACPTCGHSKDRAHIGKLSGGWEFMFQSAYECRSWQEWKIALNGRDGDIFDEYGELVPFDDFRKIVENRNSALLNHYDKHPDKYSWKDDEGYSFTDRDFS